MRVGWYGVAGSPTEVTLATLRDARLCEVGKPTILLNALKNVTQRHTALSSTRPRGSGCGKSLATVLWRKASNDTSRPMQNWKPRVTTGDLAISAGRPVVAAMIPKATRQTMFGKRPRSVPAPRSRDRWQAV